MSHEMENTKQEQHSYFLYDIDERSQQITLQKNYIGLLVNNQSSSVQQLQIRKKYTFQTSNLFPMRSTTFRLKHSIGAASIPLWK